MISCPRNLMQRTASIPGGPTMRVRHNRMEFVDGKVQEKTPKQRLKPRKLDAFAEEAVEHLKRGPPEKFDIPATTQQEIGWLLSSPMHAARIKEKGGGTVRAPMLVRNYYDENKREKDLKSRCTGLFSQNRKSSIDFYDLSDARSRLYGHLR